MSDKKGNRAISIIAGIISLILVVALCVGAGLLIRKAGSYIDEVKDSSANSLLEPSEDPSDNSSDGTSSGGTSSGGTDKDESTGGSSSENPSEDNPTDTEPVSYLTDKLVMQDGAAVGVINSRPAIRYACDVAPVLKSAMESNGNLKLHMLFMPEQALILNVNEENGIDWLNVLHARGIDYYLVSDISANENNVLYGAMEISYERINTNFIGVAVLEETSGTNCIYQYADLKAENARSAASLASVSYGHNVVNRLVTGEAILSEELENLCGAILAESASLASGMVSPSYEKSYEFANLKTDVNAENILQLSVGSTYQYDITLNPSVDLMPYCRTFTSYDDGDTYVYADNIVTVDANGKVTAISEGVVIVVICRGGAVVLQGIRVVA